MAAVSSELALVKRFHALSQKYESRPAIARRNTLPTLTRFLSNPDREMRKLSVEAVHLLAQHPNNVELLGSNEALLDNVYNVWQDARYDDPELCEVASALLSILAPTYKGVDFGGSANTSTQQVSPQRSGNVVDGNGVGPNTDDTVQSLSFTEGGNDEHGTSTTRGTSSNLRGTSDSASVEDSSACERRMSALHVVTLDVPALNIKTETAVLDKVLQTTKGVISYTIMASMHQIRVFLTVRAQVLQNALEAAGFASLVMLDEKMRSQASPTAGDIGTSHSYYDDEQQRPSYLESAKSFVSSFYSSLVVHTNPRNATLAARVKQQRESREGETADTANRLAKAIARWW